jgi:protease-4
MNGRFFYTMETNPNQPVYQQPPSYPPPPSGQPTCGLPQPPQKKRRGISCILLLSLGVIFTVLVLFVGFIGFLSTLRGKVALLEVEGIIVDAQDLVQELHYYANNPSVRAIVVRLNTPGGSTAASQELWEEIRKVRTAGRPVVASMGNVAASGGYYIACAADEIYANPASLTGSIGVIINYANWEGLTKKVGLRFEVVKKGEYKDIGSPNRPMTEAERELLVNVINDVYVQFIDDIYSARRHQMRKAYFAHHPEAEDSGTSDVVKQFLYSIADGRVFSGRQAYEYGLVDNLGNLDDAIRRAGILGRIIGKPPIYKKRKPMNIYDILRGEVKNAIRQVTSDMPELDYLFIPR